MPSATLTEYGVRLLTGLRLIDLFEKESSDYPLFWLLSPYIVSDSHRTLFISHTSTPIIQQQLIKPSR